MAAMAEPAPAIRRTRLGIEFAALYLAAPLLIALFLPPKRLFLALALLMAAGLIILWRTGGFDWRSLISGWRRLPWLRVLVFGLSVGVLAWTIMQITRPDYIRPLTPERMRFLAVVWVLYPILSALPQELIFRPLFFHRYGSLFRNERSALLVNAAVFSLAHLMYWSWIVAIMTFAGGWVFGRAYLRYGFPAAWVLHAIAGNMLFAMGMGAYFYSGNVVRPF